MHDTGPKKRGESLRNIIESIGSGELHFYLRV